MASSSRCSFCDKLPACGADRAGTRSKCPLCKGDLLSARGSSATYRLLSAEEALAEGLPVCSSRGRRAFLCACAGVAAVAIGAIIWVLNTRHAGDSSPAVASDVPRSAPAAQRIRIPEQVPAEPLAESKPVEPAPVAVVPAEVASAPVPPAVPVTIEGTATAAPAEVPVKKAPDVPRWAHRQRTEEALRLMLLDVPEVGIDDPTKPAPKNAKEAREQLLKLAKSLQEENKKNIDGVVTHFRAHRPDLAGLPYRMGKDCELSAQAANILGEVSQAVRTLKGSTRASRASPPDPKYPESVKVHLFWSQLQSMPRLQLHSANAAGALHQMLQIEPQLYRASMVEFLSKDEKNPTASAVLAQRAVFDVDGEVRYRAVEALMRRPHTEFLDVLIGALRHPWLPAAENAAETLVALDVKDAIPHLVRLVGEADPTAPFEKDNTAVVREVVRVNHLRNCLLCHAPGSGARVQDARDRSRTTMLAPVPVPGEALPPSEVYYAERSGSAVVRADVTYLRQDFSVMQPVKDAGKWPEEQRFDYLVRERPLNFAERLRFATQKRFVGPQPLSDHQQALLYALRSLTGRDAGISMRAWEEALGTEHHQRRKCDR